MSDSPVDAGTAGATGEAATDTSTTGGERADAATVRVGHRWRRVLVVVLGVLTCISILASTIGVWAHRTLLNTDSWVNAVGPLASEPEVIDAVAARVSTEVVNAIDANQVAENALPQQAAFLAAPLTEAVGQFVQRAVTELMGTEQFQEFWVQANRRVHELAVKVLRGETKGVLTANGTVQLNLLPLITDALQFVQSKAPKLVADGNPIPDITLDTPVDQAQSELSSALGRPLPEDFGVVTVFESDKLAAAQDAVTWFDRLVVALLVVTVLLLAATIVLALDRRRAVIGLGIGTVVTLVIALAVVAAVRNQVLDLIADQGTRDAVATTASTVAERLRLIVYWLLAVGTAVALVAFLTGESHVARSIRGGVARGVEYVTGTSESGAPVGLAWVQDHVTLLRWAGLVIGMGLLLFAVSGWWSLFFTLLGVGLFEAALSFAAARRREAAAPGAPPPGSRPAGA